jgi:hypothetical protein
MNGRYQQDILCKALDDPAIAAITDGNRRGAVCLVERSRFWTRADLRYGCIRG